MLVGTAVMRPSQYDDKRGESTGTGMINGRRSTTSPKMIIIC
jgi:hypothetical protein